MNHNPQMKLTCVTATWNVIKAGNRESLIRCVKSVAALKTEHEHLIYDGASTDGTAELLKELEATTPGLKVLSEPDTGIYNALNKGVHDAKGEWFYVLGADDYIIHPNVLDDLVSNLGSNDDVLISPVISQGGNKIESSECYNADGVDRLFTRACVCHQGELIRTALARSFDGFDEKYPIAADTNMFFKAHIQGLRFKYVAHPFAYFGDGGVSMSNKETTLREIRLSVANILSLRNIARWLLIEHQILPIPVCLKFLNHKDIAIRQSAKCMIFFNLKMFVRFVLYPFVAMCKMWRHKLAEN